MTRARTEKTAAGAAAAEAEAISVCVDVCSRCGVVWCALPNRVDPTPPCALPRLQVVGLPC